MALVNRFNGETLINLKELESVNGKDLIAEKREDHGSRLLMVVQSGEQETSKSKGRRKVFKWK